MKLTKEYQTFHYEDVNTYNIITRTADIHFIREEKGWEFSHTDYKTEKDRYTLNDWAFLAEINDKILELLKKLNK